MANYSQNSQLNNRKHHNKCVCEICSCGGHKCPTNHNQYAKDIIKSTFQKDYVPYKVNKSDRPKQDNKPRYHPYEKDLLKTNYQHEYVPMKVGPPEKFKRYDAANTDLPFPKGSEYSTNFQDYGTNQSKLISQQNWTKLNVPFNASSTYKSDYNKFNPRPDQPVYKNQGELNYPKNFGFNGKTTYNQDFHKHPIDTPSKNKKQQQRPPTAPFDGSTIYHTSYNGFDPKMYEKHICPVEELPQRPRQLSPGKSHLTYMYQKNGWE